MFHRFGTKMVVSSRECNQRIEDKQKKESRKRPFRLAHAKGDAWVVLSFKAYTSAATSSSVRRRCTYLCFLSVLNSSAIKTDRPYFFSGNKCRYSVTILRCSACLNLFSFRCQLEWNENRRSRCKRGLHFVKKKSAICLEKGQGFTFKGKKKTCILELGAWVLSLFIWHFTPISYPLQHQL